MLYRLLSKQAKLYGDRVAIVGEGRSLTFKQLWDESAVTAAYFQARGCKLGDPIVLGLPPSPEFYVVFYAAAALGMIVLPVLPSGRIPDLIVAKKPRWAVGNERFLQHARAHCGSLRLTLVWEPKRGLMGTDAGSRFRRKKTFRTECVIGVSSSGSTGTPTIYFRSQDLLVRRAEFRAKSLGITPEDVLLSARPFNSGSSINSHVVMPMVAGCRIVV
ncbi:MAG TPA: class I adenylate-forming enzyme family protein, partial [Candidatus Binatia bacterium]